MRCSTVFKVLFSFVLSFLFLISTLSQTATAAPISTIPHQIHEQEGLQAMAPDWSQITFASLPPISQSGEFVSPAEWSNAIGYDLSRQWKLGQTPDQYLKLGDFQDSLYLQHLNLQTIAASSQADYDLSEAALEGFKLIRQQTLESIAQAIPGLVDFKIRQIPPIEALLKYAQLDESTFDRTLKEVLEWKPELRGLKLGEIKLDRFSIDALPGLKQTPLGNLQNWENATVSQVPGLKDLPFSQFPVSLIAGGAIGVIDIAYGEKEGDRTNTITGSDVQGFQVPCRENCAYAELTGPRMLHGKQWISGKFQKVRGGRGLLGKVNDGKEPTGRHPFGKLFKVVIWDVVESEGRVDTALFFRIFQRSLFADLGCTPYFIGPIPFMSYHERDPILVGFLDDQGGATTQASIPEEVFEKARAAGVPLDDETPTWNDSNSSLCGETSGTVDLSALAEGISGIEGGYNSVGYYDPEAGGRGLGRYQYMTFRNDVRAIIQKRPGGADFLSRADVNNNSQSYRAALERELPQYFTQADQDALFKQDQRNNIRTAMQQIDPKTGQPFTGTRLVERLGQIHFGGSDPQLIDSGASDIHGRLSMYSYGKELARNYQLALRKKGRDCVGSGKATGKMIYPQGANAPIPSGGYFGADRGDHYHAGLDFSVPMGTPIKAADGGTVEFAGRTAPDGYGTLIIINHGNGLKTYYGHPSEISVKTGQKVAQGQIIGGVGAEGRSTGPHLHFEVRKNGTPVDPIPYLRK